MSVEKNILTYPYLGFGLGLRTPHYDYILKHKPKIDWFEIISENFMVDGGPPLHFLDAIRQDYPIVMHGVSLSLGSTDPFKQDYLNKLKILADRVQPKWISDHLCWTGVDGKNMHDLLPLPYSEEVITHVVSRIQQVQEFLGRRILIENLSSYITYKDSVMPEWEFLSEIANRADCLILLDINNIYVSAFNHNFNPNDYLSAIPKQRVQQFHMAGHNNFGDYIIDTHDHGIIQDVWQLYELAVRHFGKVSTMIERDENIPEFPVLEAELNQARKIANQVWSKADEKLVI